MDTKTVMFAISELRIVSAQHYLREAGIESWVVDKKDSAHAGIFGEIELHVENENADKARKILLDEEIVVE